MSKDKFSEYVRVTSDGNVAVRGSAYEPWPDELNQGASWYRSGWSPDMARRLADYIRGKADLAELVAKYPEHWPPRSGEVWTVHAASGEYDFTVLGNDPDTQRRYDHQTGNIVPALWDGLLIGNKITLPYSRERKASRS